MKSNLNQLLAAFGLFVACAYGTCTVHVAQAYLGGEVSDYTIKATCTGTHYCVIPFQDDLHERLSKLTIQHQVDIHDEYRWAHPWVVSAEALSDQALCGDLARNWGCTVTRESAIFKNEVCNPQNPEPDFSFKNPGGQADAVINSTSQDDTVGGSNSRRRSIPRRLPGDYV